MIDNGLELIREQTSISRKSLPESPTKVFKLDIEECKLSSNDDKYDFKYDQDDENEEAKPINESD